MKIVAIACARNEADVIEAFARHTLSYVQQLIILDHGSADDTPNILSSLQSEGLNLHVITDPTVGNFQTAHMNHMLEMAVCEYAADWVVCLDADEFLQGDLAESLAQASTSREPFCVKVPLRNYVAHLSDQSEIVNPVERLKHHDLNENQGNTFTTYKVMVPRELAQGEGGFLEQGNHRFLCNGFEAPFRMLPGVWLGHFSLRQPCQYASKLVSKTLQKYRQVAARTHNEDFYELPYRQLRESYSSFVKEFPKARLSWAPGKGEEKLVADPIEYQGGALRYTPANLDADQLIKQILDLTENLARAQPQDNGNDAENSDPAPAFVSISSGADGETDSVQNQLHTSDPCFVSLAFPLQDLGDCDSLILGVSTEPCILEIESISLTYQNGDRPTRIWGVDELNTMLKVQEQGVIINSAGVIRIMVSQLPMYLKFHGWRKDQEPMPVEATLKVRCVRRPSELVSIILAPNVIGQMTQQLGFSIPIEDLNNRIEDLNNRIEYLNKKLRNSTEKLQRISKRPLKFLLRSWKERWFKPKPSA